MTGLRAVRRETEFLRDIEREAGNYKHGLSGFVRFHSNVDGADVASASPAASAAARTSASVAARADLTAAGTKTTVCPSSDSSGTATSIMNSDDSEARRSIVGSIVSIDGNARDHGSNCTDGTYNDCYSGTLTEGGQRAKELLQEMSTGTSKLRPNAIAYGCAIRAVGAYRHI